MGPRCRGQKDEFQKEMTAGTVVFCMLLPLGAVCALLASYRKADH